MASIKTIAIHGIDLRDGTPMSVNVKTLAFDNLAIYLDPVTLEEDKLYCSAWTVAMIVAPNWTIFQQRFEGHEDIIAATMAIDSLFSDMPLETALPEYDIWLKRNKDKLIYWRDWLDSR